MVLMTTKPSTQKNANGYYRGVLRDESGKVVWMCVHQHRNRDRSQRRHGQIQFNRSAFDCARQMAK